MKYISILLILVFLSFKTFSQEITNRDSSETIRTTENMVHFGLGVQKSFYTELGYAKLISQTDGYDYLSKVLYTAVEYIPKLSKENENIYGLKAGFVYSTSPSFGYLGLDLKYLSNFKKSDFLITPKIGFSLLGYIGIFYGYNFQIEKTFRQIGHHQFGLDFNLNRRIFKE